AGGGGGVGWMDSRTERYLGAEAGGGMTLAGSFAGPRGADPDTVGATARPEELVPVVRAASRRVPALADAGIARGVSGVYDMTPDARPLLGPVDGVAGLIIAAGFSGMGF